MNLWILSIVPLGAYCSISSVEGAGPCQPEPEQHHHPQGRGFLGAEQGASRPAWNLVTLFPSVQVTRLTLYDNKINAIHPDAFDGLTK